MPLHLEYRPESLNDFFGNKALKDQFKNTIEREDDIPHAILFEGPYGSGKTTLARIVAKTLGCEPKDSNIDFKEINCGSDGNIDTIKSIIKEAKYKPLQSKNRVYILDEAHAIGGNVSGAKNYAQRALLKLLEDTPKTTYIILCTTDPGMLVKTIISRCTIFKVEKLDNRTMKSLVQSILKKEEVSDFPDDAIDAIIDAADGHPRDALKLLDSTIDLEEENIIPSIHKYKTTDKKIFELYWALIKDEGWDKISVMLNDFKQQGENPESIRRMIVSTASTMMLKKGQDKYLDNHFNIGMAFDHERFNSDFGSLTLRCFEFLED